MNNPFWYGNLVPPQQLIDRQENLRKLTGRITTGQSTALVGPPQSGKTSILHYLIAPKNQVSLYSDIHINLYISSGTYPLERNKNYCAVRPAQ
jgi:AAA+ ATPase superfamily predicted ATPase